MSDEIINEKRKEVKELIIKMSSIKEDTIDNKIQKLKLVSDILNIVINLMATQAHENHDIYSWEITCVENMSNKQKVLLNSIYKNITNEKGHTN